ANPVRRAVGRHADGRAGKTDRLGTSRNRESIDDGVGNGKGLDDIPLRKEIKFVIKKTGCGKITARQTSGDALDDLIVIGRVVVAHVIAVQKVNHGSFAGADA